MKSSKDQWKWVPTEGAASSSPVHGGMCYFIYPGPGVSSSRAPFRCLCEPAGPWAPLPLRGPMRGLRWGCRPVLLLVWYRSSFGMGCHSWRHAELSTAQGRLLCLYGYWAPRLLPKTCSSEWPGLISAGLVGKQLLCVYLLGSDGPHSRVAGPLRVSPGHFLSFHPEAAKVTEGYGAATPRIHTWTSVLLAECWVLLPLLLDHITSETPDALLAVRLLLPPHCLSRWDVPAGYGSSDGHCTTPLHWTGLSHRVNQQIHAHTMRRTWGDKACPPTARPRHV